MKFAAFLLAGGAVLVAIMHVLDYLDSVSLPSPSDDEPF